MDTGLSQGDQVYKCRQILLRYKKIRIARHLLPQMENKKRRAKLRCEATLFTEKELKVNLEKANNKKALGLN